MEKFLIYPNRSFTKQDMITFSGANAGPAGFVIKNAASYAWPQPNEYSRVE